MSSFFTPRVTFSRGTFSIFIAPSPFVSEALSHYLARHQGSTLCLSGNIPVILSRITTTNSQLRMQHITDAYHLLTTLQEAHELLILIEHERSFYDTDADLIRSIGLICRRKVAERATIFMVASRPDEWLYKFEPFAHKMAYIEEIVPEHQGANISLSSRSRQRTLEGIY